MSDYMDWKLQARVMVKLYKEDTHMFVSLLVLVFDR